MWILITIIIVLILLIIKWRDTKQNLGGLETMPGPPAANLLWRSLTGQRSDPYKTHLTMSELATKYGPIFKILGYDQNMVVVSDYEGLLQLTVKTGRDLSGRFGGFRFSAVLENTGILGNSEADVTWKTLRKTTQRHLKQFGEGMNRLEAIIASIAEDMFDGIEEKVGLPFDPKSLFFDTALNSIAFLITGERTRSGDPVVEMMREYEVLFFKCIPVDVPFSIRILDFIPWLRYVGLPSWKLFKRLLTLEKKIWRTVNEMNDADPESESVCRVLRDHVLKGGVDGGVILTETDVRKATLALLLAGVATTSRTFYALVNMIAHDKAIQDKLHHEIKSVTNDSANINLKDKSKLHYCRAVIMEGHRYISVLPLAVRHSASKETRLQGYTIPVNTVIHPNLWHLHHDVGFWGDPFVFRPERFLEDHGQLIPPDHPNRKHLMPFGAGPRVCLGENLANTRLLLWLTTLIQRYEVIPAESNLKDSTDVRRFRFGGMVIPTPFEVIFTKRQ